MESHIEASGGTHLHGVLEVRQFQVRVMAAGAVVHTDIYTCDKEDEHYRREQHEPVVHSKGSHHARTHISPQGERDGCHRDEEDGHRRERRPAVLDAGHDGR